VSKTHWHFPRSEFAESIYKLLADGPIQAITLFGPRRTGKTQFLTQDLAPLAENKSHRVVYASLWQTIDSPLGILLYEFDIALREGSFLSRVRSAASDIAPKFKLSAPFAAGQVEIDLAKLKGKAPESHLLLLDQYCEKLANENKPTFLLFDEFQEITRSKVAEPLVAALRTSLDKRKDGLVAVFTGSSQEGLRSMFSTRQAPFYRFAQPAQLPSLDSAFVDHQLQAFRATSKAKVERVAAIAIFERFERNPLFFQRWLMTLALNPDLPGEEAVERVQSEVAEEFGFMARWIDLSAPQRLVVRMLACGVKRIYSKEASEFAEKLTSATAPPPSRLQTALERLSRLGLVDEWEDDLRLSDPLFESWVRERPPSEF